MKPKKNLRVGDFLREIPKEEQKTSNLASLWMFDYNYIINKFALSCFIQGQEFFDMTLRSI